MLNFLKENVRRPSLNITNSLEQLRAKRHVRNIYFKSQDRHFALAGYFALVLDIIPSIFSIEYEVTQPFMNIFKWKHKIHSKS